MTRGKKREKEEDEGYIGTLRLMELMMVMQRG